MNLPFQIENKLDKFLKPRIYFTNIHNQYLYDDKWLNDMTEETFKKEALDILNLVNDHVVAGQDTRDFLKELREMASIQIDSYRENLESPKFIDSIDVINYCHTYSPEEEKYNIQDILEEKESIMESIFDENNYYVDLYRFAKDFNNYANPIDIEKVKLKYVLKLHYDYMITIYGYVDCLLEDFNRINFKKFDFEKLLISFNLIEQKSQIETIRKCNINSSKIDVANLFLLLMDEKELVFDKDERKNKVMMQDFIEQNFTYKDDDGSYRNIININKEFSKVNYSNSLSHKSFLESFISKLEARLSRIK